MLQALRVSVGQLGIIGRIKLKIVKEIPVRRWVTAVMPLPAGQGLQHLWHVCGEPDPVEPDNSQLAAHPQQC